jgi:pseudaminic acid synthase
MKNVKIEGRAVGPGEPCFVIAEISCNHLQKKGYALKLIEEAKAVGADAVKFQTYTADTTTIDSDKEHFKLKGTIWEGKTLYELYLEAYTPWEWFPELKDKATEEGLVFFSTPSDTTSVDFLEELKVPLYKIASFEINHVPLLKYVASKKKPVIISTGVATLSDVELALKTIRDQGNDQIMLMKCTSAYPAPLDEIHLKTIPNMAEAFGVPVGLSDHTLSTAIPAAAVALGACAVEKHLILRRSDGGHDAKFSLEPSEFKGMVNSIRESEKALGKVTYEQSERVKEHRFIMRSIFAAKDIKKGEVLTVENIKVVRPAYGLHPKYYEVMVKKKATRDIEKGTPLDWSMVG